MSVPPTWKTRSYVTVEPAPFHCPPGPLAAETLARQRLWMQPSERGDLLPPAAAAGARIADYIPAAAGAGAQHDPAAALSPSPPPGQQTPYRWRALVLIDAPGSGREDRT